MYNAKSPVRRLINSYIGARIKFFRRQLSPSLSQEALGESVGLSQPQIFKYESGQSLIPADILLPLGEKLGVTPQSFCDGIALIPDWAAAESKNKTMNPNHLTVVPEDALKLAEAFNALNKEERELFINPPIYKCE